MRLVKKNLYLSVTIDTEMDKMPNWYNSNPVTFKGVLQAIPNKLTPLFEKYSIKPTYMLSPEVIENEDCVKVLKELTNCELAAHLHGDFIEPNPRKEQISGAYIKEMQCEYDNETEYKKLENLTNLFYEKIGYKPFSFRAGRYGIGKYSGKALMELGYKLDTSVTPNIIWTDSQGNKRPDFTDLPENPYYINICGNIFKEGESDFLEVPVTVVQNIEDENKYTNGAWLRPWYSHSDAMIKIIDNAVETANNSDEPQILVMMFHNVELVPKASPYPQTDDDVVKYLNILEKIFMHTTGLNIKPVTLKEFYDIYKS